MPVSSSKSNFQQATAMYSQNTVMFQMIGVGLKMCYAHFLIEFQLQSKERALAARRAQYAKFNAAIKSRKVQYVSDLVH